MSRKVRLVMLTFLGAAGALAALWWAVFALEPYEIAPAALDARYDHAVPGRPAAALQLGAVESVTVGDTPALAQSIAFTSFDGERVVGRLVRPAGAAGDADAGSMPLMLAMHAMGRTQWRWWASTYKDRPTIENTHRLAERALQAGFAVVAIDARGHGDRKDPAKPLVARELLRDLHWWGAREPYERLIVDSVRDWRVLLDALAAAAPALDTRHVRAVGYSMGAQMALLLAAVDPRVRSVAAVVPPATGPTVAAVAPTTAAPRLAATEVWLLSGDDDEYGSVAEQAALFAALPGPRKTHLRFAAGHLLPASWPERLAPWFAAGAAPAASP